MVKKGYLDENGHELPSDKPVAIPARILRAQQNASDLQRFMENVHALNRAMAEAGEETFEEADDFYIEDEVDFQPYTQYELDSDVAELVQYDRSEKKRAEREAALSGGGEKEEGVSDGGEGEDEGGDGGCEKPSKSSRPRGKKLGEELEGDK